MIDSEGLLYKKSKEQPKPREFEGFIKKEEPRDEDLEMVDETEEALLRKQ